MSYASIGTYSSPETQQFADISHSNLQWQSDRVGTNEDTWKKIAQVYSPTQVHNQPHWHH
jgi:hypothetical protein